MAGLIVKFIDTPNVFGGKAIALCDEHGEMLPMQTSASMNNGTGGHAEITATFIIDGKQVRIAD